MISAPDRRQAVGLIREACQGGARLKRACAELGIDVRTYQRWRGSAPVKADARPGALRPEPVNKLESRGAGAGVGALPRTRLCEPAAGAGRPPIGRSGPVYRLGVEFLPHSAGGGRAPPPGPRPAAEPPRLVARAPNEGWTWDISWLPGPVKGLFFYLYLIVDLYSRKIVGWEFYVCESAEYAAEVVRRAVLAEGCVDQPLVLHADNGRPMKGETLLETLYRLGIATSYSRPRTSNDNPYSEVLFRTCKYCPAYPTQGFAGLEEARAWMQQFVYGSDHEHRPSGIRFVTPQQRHSGQDQAILAQRQALYEQARARHPERWSRAIRNWNPITEVWLNPTAEVIDVPAGHSQTG
jgi:putative transposase